MNPILLEAGPLTLHTYPAWIGGGVLAALLVIAWRAYAHAGAKAVAPWLDVALAGIVGGVIGARLLHVAIFWDFFESRTDQITRLDLGGLAWHGAIIGAALFALPVMRWRGVPLRPWSDALALGLPLGISAAWLGCRAAGSAYGYEVDTLANWPGWLAAELPDIYGLQRPRLDIQSAGALWGVILLALIATLTALRWLSGLRLWLALALTGLVNALLAFLRADPAQHWLDHRHDQILDVSLLLASTCIGAALWLRARAQQHMRDQLAEQHTVPLDASPGASPEGYDHETQTRTGPDGPAPGAHRRQPGAAPPTD